jgi:hypothetical protein
MYVDELGGKLVERQRRLEGCNAAAGYQDALSLRHLGMHDDAARPRRHP